MNGCWKSMWFSAQIDLIPYFYASDWIAGERSAAKNSFFFFGNNFLQSLTPDIYFPNFGHRLIIIMCMCWSPTRHTNAITHTFSSMFVYVLSLRLAYTGTFSSTICVQFSFRYILNISYLYFDFVFLVKIESSFILAVWATKPRRINVLYNWTHTRSVICIDE